MLASTMSTSSRTSRVITSFISAPGAHPDDAECLVASVARTGGTPGAMLLGGRHTRRLSVDQRPTWRTHGTVPGCLRKDSRMPLVTICLPAYRSAPFIRHTLTALREQTFRDFRV